MTWWLIAGVLILLWVAVALPAAIVIGRAIARADRLEHTDDQWWGEEFGWGAGREFNGNTPTTLRDTRSTHRAA